ncbi:carboxymuconolactone decarboxylase family protein [Streptomyces sp. OfavH-34-F]|uniref:carboxymuconolactone decarboxylase family protein n=1 Tax=unclassified Streptomyces TaxID=2593676 RepID=UPI001EF33D65|nr:carboxymuconolactone decarboxylase family protein [Streptomyces sp. OfavH-34-F]MCG7525249.1 carboxymuconolactone decarboxylase family protein [Streptomyces sp. OfavH-34-F]
MAQRMGNPSLVVPGALQPLLDLSEVIGKVGVPQSTLDYVRLRVASLNGRVYTFPTEPEDKRLRLVDEWRTEPSFSDAERAALELAEAVTRQTDADSAPSDEVWANSAAHYDDVQLGALVMHISLVNFWNRVNVATHQDDAVWR